MKAELGILHSPAPMFPCGWILLSIPYSFVLKEEWLFWRVTVGKGIEHKWSAPYGPAFLLQALVEITRTQPVSALSDQHAPRAGIFWFALAMWYAFCKWKAYGFGGAEFNWGRKY